MENIPPYFLGLLGPFVFFIAVVWYVISIDREVVRILRKDDSDED